MTMCVYQRAVKGRRCHSFGHSRTPCEVQTNNGTVYEGIFDSLRGCDVVLRYAKMLKEEGKEKSSSSYMPVVIVKGAHLAQLQADNIRADGELIGASRVVKSGFDGDSYVIDTSKCAAGSGDSERAIAAQSACHGLAVQHGSQKRAPWGHAS